MSNNKEIKGNLARLLATENLVVEHKQCYTASFDVDRRILTLPNWDKASDIVYDIHIALECYRTSIGIEGVDYLKYAGANRTGFARRELVLRGESWFCAATIGQLSLSA